MSINATIKNIFAISILSFVGAVFVFKYGARITSDTNILFLIVAIYIVSYASFFFFLMHAEPTQYAWLGSQRILFAIFGVLIVGAIAVVTISPDASRVWRYPAIVEWIDRLLVGQFPWGRQTQFNPSGMPFLFIMALPFYYLGNIGYLEVVGVILFCLILFQFYPQHHTKWLPLFSLILLPSFYYELLVRSELFFNMVIIISIIALSERYLDTGKLNSWFFVLAIFFGLGLSTRTIVGLVYAGYYTYKFRHNIWQGILFSGFTLLIFGITLLPFVIGNVTVFFREGPFSVQLRYLPTGITIIFVVLAVIIGFTTTNINDVLFYEGLLLFVIVVIAFLPAVTHLGLYRTILEDGFDITYFIFCIPFLLLSIGNQQRISVLKATG